MPPRPSRGEVWTVDLEPVLGHEQGGRTRPCLIVSTDTFNHGRAELVIAIPVTTKWKGIPIHVPVSPPEGGLTQPSFIKCEDVRSISTLRLKDFWGRVEPATLKKVESNLRTLLDL